MRRTFLALIVAIFLSAQALAVDPVIFRIKTDNIPQAEIAGWALPAKSQAKGTLFMCHGFRNNKDSFRWFDWIRDIEGWNVVAFDFREHGESTHGLTALPTLGYYEIWDLKAVIDWAEKQGYAKPYACYGVSMGASTALRWAGEDHRIVGVLAQSPFKNAWRGAQQFRIHFANLPLGMLAPAVIHGGLREMWKQVEIPDAVAKRSDLRLWITVGDQDFFPEADQREILTASKSPENMKRLIVRQNSRHSGAWAWKENNRTIVEFLNACQDKTPAKLPSVGSHYVGWMTAGGGAAAGLAMIAWRWGGRCFPRAK